MSTERVCYQITSANNAAFIKRIEFLLSKHMVFTNSRLKTVEAMKSSYGNGEVNSWKVIWICHDRECKRVMNTGASRRTSYYGDTPITVIRFDKFVKEILPTL